MSAEKSSSWFRLSKLEVAVVIGVNLVLIAILLPAVQHARDAARRVEARNNLKQIGLALYNYHDLHKTFPPGCTTGPDDEPLQGWMLMTSLWFCSNAFSDYFVEERSWEAPVNRFMATTPWPANMWQNPGESEVFTEDGYSLTHVMGNPLVFHRNSYVTLDDFEQGTSNVWGAGEISGGFRPYVYPYNWRTWTGMLNSGEDSFGRHTGDGAFFLMMDGSVRFIANAKSGELHKVWSGGLPSPAPDDVAQPKREFQVSHRQSYFSRERLQSPTPPHDCGFWFTLMRSPVDSGDVAMVDGDWKCDSWQPITGEDLKNLQQQCTDVRTFVLPIGVDPSMGHMLAELPRLETLWVASIESVHEFVNDFKNTSTLSELLINRIDADDLRHLRRGLPLVNVTDRRWPARQFSHPPQHPSNP